MTLLLGRLINVQQQRNLKKSPATLPECFRQVGVARLLETSDQALVARIGHYYPRFRSLPLSVMSRSMG